MIWRRLDVHRRRTLFGAAISCVLALHVATDAAQQSRAVFRAATHEAQIHVTVVDRAGHLVTDLQAADFEVQVAGRPVTITAFSNAPQPISAVLLLDMSFPLADRFFQMRDAANRFVDALEPGDQVRVGSFGREVSLSPWLTDDKVLLKAILGEELWPLDGGIALLQAVDQSSRSLSDVRRPATVLVLGHGGDGPFKPQGVVTRFHVTLEQVRHRLLADRMMVYSVRFEGLWRTPQELRVLARESGGGDVEIKVDTDLVSTVHRIANELRRQYLVGFAVDARDDGIHRVDVRLPGRPDLTVRAPRGYVARGR